MVKKSKFWLSRIAQEYGSNPKQLLNQFITVKDTVLEAISQENPSLSAIQNEQVKLRKKQGLGRATEDLTVKYDKIFPYTSQHSANLQNLPE